VIGLALGEPSADVSTAYNDNVHPPPSKSGNGCCPAEQTIGWLLAVTSWRIGADLLTG
jgi:hypothetical protein